MERLFNNPDFYPTPNEVIEQMVGVSQIAGKVILEPSAGKGNIVDHVMRMGAKEVLACELSHDLRKILQAKCRIIEDDFMKLTADRVSHVNMIIMNPPFTRDEQHILHAWDIAPGGCEIISLCNSNTISERCYTRNREMLRELIKLNGTSENFGQCFEQSERNTGVSISCVRLFKPKAGEQEFEGYFDLAEEDEDGADQSGIMTYNAIVDIVGRYVEGVKMFDSVYQAEQAINAIIKPLESPITFGAFRSRGDERTQITRDTFKKDLQISAWKSIFGKMNMRQYVTTGVMADINKFVEQQVHVPFTVKNVYKMIQMIVGTHGDRMDKVLVEAFEKICSFSAQNSTAGETWKTNSNYKINKKFIHGYVCDYDGRWPTDHLKIHCSAGDRFDDIVKALCHLTGQRYEEQMSLYQAMNNPYRIKVNGKYLAGYENFDSRLGSIEHRRDELIKGGINATIEHTPKPEWGQWFDWSFFRCKGFKKGTMHFEFKDEKLLQQFNLRVAKIKGWRLPSDTTYKPRAKSKEVVLF